jgi:hypothetical protein
MASLNVANPGSSIAKAKSSCHAVAVGSLNDAPNPGSFVATQGHLAVKGFINLKLGTRAFCLKTYRRRDEARFFIEFEFITACDWYKKTRWTY